MAEKALEALLVLLGTIITYSCNTLWSDELLLVRLCSNRSLISPLLQCHDHFSQIATLTADNVQ
jgi:hypothetical protein